MVCSCTFHRRRTVVVSHHSLGFSCILLLLFANRISAFATNPRIVQNDPSQRVVSVSAPVPRHRTTTVTRSISRQTLLLFPTATTTTATTIAWTLGHVVAGALPTPIVIGATKTWYRRIDLPAWTPPDQLFGPVWTVLYACMGVAVARVVQQMAATVATATTTTPPLLWTHPTIVLWMGHFLLNVTWAPVFFGLQRLRAALLMNYGLLASLCFGILPRFASSNALSAWLLVPYAVWLLYATALNQAVCRLNPTVKGYNNAMLQADLLKLQQGAAKYAGL